MRRTIARVREDLTMIVVRDPSIRSRGEALLHPALPALWSHRLAHVLSRRGFRRVARMLAHVTRAVTGGIEIHPDARLGRRVFIDHGAAVVIGETACIGDDVTIYHQVTLGAVGWRRDNGRSPDQRRHPAIGNGVVIGVGATVLGPVTVGDGAVVGAASLVLTDVPAGARVLAAPSTIVRSRPPADAADARDPVDSLRELASAGCW